jgi:hypothetical protein
LRFQLVTIGYTVTTNGYKLHNWLQILALLVTGFKRPLSYRYHTGIISVTYRRTQQPRTIAPLCVLSLLPARTRPPLMLRTATPDFVNFCQLIAALISLFITPKKFHNADGHALFKGVGKMHPRRSGQPLVNLQQLRTVGRSLFYRCRKNSARLTYTERLTIWTAAASIQ